MPTMSDKVYRFKTELGEVTFQWIQENSLVFNSTNPDIDGSVGGALHSLAEKLCELIDRVEALENRAEPPQFDLLDRTK